MNFPASWDVEMNWEVNGSELRAEASFVYLIWNSAILRFRGVSDFIKPAWRFKNDSWQGRRFWAWGSACKLQRVTFWFGFLCILAWRLEFVLFFFFETCTILDLGPHLWRVSCHLFIHSLSPLYYSHYIPRFLCCWGHWGQEKNTGFDEQLPWNNFFPGEGCDEDWPDVLDILWQRTSGWEAWRLFVTADFCSKKKGIFQRLIDFQSDKFLGTCRKWEWKWHRFDIFSLACACQAQLTSFHKLLWLFVYMHWYFDSWEA